MSTRVSQKLNYKALLPYVLFSIGAGTAVALIIRFSSVPVTATPTQTKAPSTQVVQRASDTPSPSKTPSPSDTPSSSNTPTCESLEAKITGDIRLILFTGERIDLFAQANGRALEYSWESDGGQISDPHAASIVYRAPQSAGDFTVRLKVYNRPYRK